MTEVYKQLEGMFGASGNADYSQGDNVRFYDIETRGEQIGQILHIIPASSEEPTQLIIAVGNNFPSYVSMSDIIERVE